jgi:hypothetical protein
MMAGAARTGAQILHPQQVLLKQSSSCVFKKSNFVINKFFPTASLAKFQK